MKLTDQQARFFETFGYLKLPRAFAREAEWILSEFEQVFADRKIVHDGTKRSSVVPFIDQREKLCALLDHPTIVGAAKALLGEDFNYLGGDGNYYTGDTMWHTDGFHVVGRYLKMAFYLDPVRADSGALRVVPGSHHPQTNWTGRNPRDAEMLYGIKPAEYPAVALDSDPGDLLIFNHNIMHAAFGGSGRRRMFTLNLSRRAETTGEVADLEAYINGHDRFWLDSLHSDTMRRTAGPERRRHLQQVHEHEIALPARSAKCRAMTQEPSRH